MPDNDGDGIDDITGQPIPTPTPAPGTAPYSSGDIAKALAEQQGQTSNKQPGDDDQLLTRQLGLTTMGAVRDWFWGLPDASWRKIADKLQDAGLLPPGAVTQSDVWRIYQNIAAEAAIKYKSVNADMPTFIRNQIPLPTLDDILDGYAKHPIGGDQSGKGLPDKYSITNTQAEPLTDPEEASQLLEDVLTERLGRAPTEAESAAFLAALNAKQRQNPTSTTTTYTKDPASGQYNTSSTTTGGVNEDAFADQWGDTHNEAEAGAYQMATTYFDALLGALGPVTGKY